MKLLFAALIVLHAKYPDDFGFNKDGHAHDHEDMKAAEETRHDNL